MNWVVFANRFGVWCYETGQTKTLAALEKIAEKIPDSVLNSLPPTRIFTPSRELGSASLMVEIRGQVFSPAQPLLYLSPLSELVIKDCHSK